MKRAPVRWNRALRALASAAVLVVVVLFVAGNFVLVDVRLLWLHFETRVAWLPVVAGAVGFAGGVRWSGSRRRR